MNRCEHIGKIKAVCIFEGCDSKDLVMCPDCMYVNHTHPAVVCVRLDFARDQVSPFIELAKKKQSLEA